MPIGPTQRETPTLLCHAPSEVDTTAADRFGSHEAMEATDMTTIKATCPVCGDVDLTPIDVRLTVAESAGWATYTFRCTECHDQVEKPADEEVVALLSIAGVVIDRVPAEALEGHTGPPFSYDDVLDFALWLDG
ncbi:MAG: hypothetical protein WBB77_10510, partial [Candidatus Nanopelagicales bacterium]